MPNSEEVHLQITVKWKCTKISIPMFTRCMELTFHLEQWPTSGYLGTPGQAYQNQKDFQILPVYRLLSVSVISGFVHTDDSRLHCWNTQKRAPVSKWLQKNVLLTISGKRIWCSILKWLILFCLIEMINLRLVSCTLQPQLKTWNDNQWKVV